MKKKKTISSRYWMFFLPYIGVSIVLFLGTRDLGDWRNYTFLGILLPLTAFYLIVYMSSLRMKMLGKYLIIKKGLKRIKIYYDRMESITFITDCRYEDYIVFVYFNGQGERKKIRGTFSFISPKVIKQIVDSIPNNAVRIFIGSATNRLKEYSTGNK